jgi:hypothetical protein
MNRWADRIRVGALALSVAGMLASCGGGGGGNGGGNSLLLFFGINGEGTCSNVVVTVDLGDADAVLARNDDGGPDCKVDTTLAGNGCFATFTELNNGANLRATIAGCTIPAVTNLFSCTFEEVDVSDLVTESRAQCTCAAPGCDNGPPLCIDMDPDPRSCEDCDNGRDDDGNGQVDCDDPNCRQSPSCSGSTTTTTTGAVTSTTAPAEPLLVSFVLSSSSRVALSALRFTVNYTSAPGRFDGVAAAVRCTNKVNGAAFTRDNRSTVRKLALGWILSSGFSAPRVLATCEFLPREPEPVPANFTVVINEATGLTGDPVKVAVDVTVTRAP